MNKAKKDEKRELIAVYHPVGWRVYPHVYLRGFWLAPYGFKPDMPVRVLLEKGKITISRIEE